MLGIYVCVYRYMCMILVGVIGQEILGMVDTSVKAYK